MNFVKKILRGIDLWQHYPKDQIRWMLRERKNRLGQEQFLMGNVAFPYFLHAYNRTWTNERAVEIQHFLSSIDASRILEVGNVLSHYFDLDHTVVDMNEHCRFRAVIGSDITTFNSDRRFDRIISISTIEHVGWDENPRSESKALDAFSKLRTLLEPNGKALVTIPVGYNAFLDQCIRDASIDGAEFKFLKRISANNQWLETDAKEALGCRYGHPFRSANAMVFIYLYPDAKTSN